MDGFLGLAAGLVRRRQGPGRRSRLLLPSKVLQQPDQVGVDGRQVRRQGHDLLADGDGLVGVVPAQSLLGELLAESDPLVGVAFQDQGLGQRTPHLVLGQAQAHGLLQGGNRLGGLPQADVGLPQQAPGLGVRVIASGGLEEGIHRLGVLALLEKLFRQGQLCLGGFGRELAHLCQQAPALGRLSRPLGRLGGLFVLGRRFLPPPLLEQEVAELRQQHMIRRIEPRQALIDLDHLGGVACLGVMLRHGGELDLGFPREPLLFIQIGTGQERLGPVRIQLDDLLVDRDGLHRQPVGPIQLAQLEILLDGLGRLPGAGIKVPKVVADGQVVGVGLEDRLIFGDGLVPLPLLRIGEGALKGFPLVECHSQRTPFSEGN